MKSIFAILLILSRYRRLPGASPDGSGHLANTSFSAIIQPMNTFTAHYAFLMARPGQASLCLLRLLLP